MKTHRFKSIIVMMSALLGATSLYAERTRSTEPVTFGNKSLSLTIAPDAAVSLMRDGKLVSEPDSMGWSIYCWTDSPKNSRTRTKLDNMANPLSPHLRSLQNYFAHFRILLLPDHCSPVTLRSFQPLFPPQPPFSPSPIPSTAPSSAPPQKQIPSSQNN